MKKDMQTLNKQLEDDEKQLLVGKQSLLTLENKNKDFFNKLSVEYKKVSDQEYKLFEEQNKVKMIEKMSAKEKEELKSLVRTIEAKEKQES